MTPVYGHWLVGLFCGGLVLLASASVSDPEPTAGVPVTAASPTRPQTQVSKDTDEREDHRRHEVRAYPIGHIKKIGIRNTKFYDSNNKLCSSDTSAKLTPRRIRYFLKNAVPVSQISLINYYGVYGECLSKDVDVLFRDDRMVRISFASESETAYLASIVGGKEVEVYFYYCEKCAL